MQEKWLEMAMEAIATMKTYLNVVKLFLMIFMHPLLLLNCY
jgi:hypothetical protein